MDKDISIPSVLPIKNENEITQPPTPTPTSMIDYTKDITLRRKKIMI